MNRNPEARELLRAVAGWLGTGEEASRFDRAVAANAIGIVEREIACREGVDSAAATRIAALLGIAATDRPAMDAALVATIRRGGLAPDDAALLEHLRLCALDDLAIDQPRYVHALAEPFA